MTRDETIWKYNSLTLSSREGFKKGSDRIIFCDDLAPTSSAHAFTAEIEMIAVVLLQYLAVAYEQACQLGKG